MFLPFDIHHWGNWKDACKPSRLLSYDTVKPREEIPVCCQVKELAAAHVWTQPKIVCEGRSCTLKRQSSFWKIRCLSLSKTAVSMCQILYSLSAESTRPLFEAGFIFNSPSLRCGYILGCLYFCLFISSCLLCFVNKKTEQISFAKNVFSDTTKNNICTDLKPW